MSRPNQLPTRRGTELLFVVAATLIVACAEAFVEITRNSELSSHVATYPLVVLGIGLVCHLAIRRAARYADPLLLPCAVLLVGLGLVMIHRLDLGLAQQAAENGTTYTGVAAASQVVWAFLGLAVFLVVLLVIRDHRSLARYAYTLALIGLFLLMLPAVLPAQYSEVNGARIWIRIAGFSIQPGEIAKIALTIFAASYLVDKRDVLSLAGRRLLGVDLPRGRDLGPVLVAWLISMGVLVRNHDLGTALMFFGLFVVLLYVATERVSWVIIGVLLFAGGCVLSYELFGTVKQRVTVWLHVFDYLQDEGYQMSQSLFGLGTGGLFGAGLGGGRPELVPVAKSDFILSSFGEELGLFGLVAILSVYLIILSRGFATALAVRDSFGKLLVTGLTFSLGLQLFVVAGGISRLLPETGLTTPFLSYGGSSLVANFGLLALLLRVSDAARRPPTTPPSAVTTDSGPVPIQARGSSGGPS
ncbi:FtsW/RodA/SpoVE family cell cycle protein [Jatrophihabitans sp.]|uniref:FtsW/RodA/SpoVE family cell cycle protein n=1 Tax=Jatrophihabitans sp. TaxID=1932789 RepID=UPI002C472E7C|nr:FtsW/RodA/SpoVE family cell cycle protein [Jatrophihabitans sp.]